MVLMGHANPEPDITTTIQSNRIVCNNIPGMRSRVQQIVGYCRDIVTNSGSLVRLRGPRCGALVLHYSQRGAAISGFRWYAYIAGHLFMYYTYSFLISDGYIQPLELSQSTYLPKRRPSRQCWVERSRVFALEPHVSWGMYFI